ncbi:MULTISPECIES: orotidine-5'-phosphate decarboxylase [unclassified Methylophilus]|uniref:orotidine-5'-phosphate decarboxylase n=1 Tax=unclassified Methylophilus TaxID=2630143 RepID=UPI0006F34C01|nr:MULTISPECIES: orotidine-5'-phosphate decarboxylase [unclassified Methylophilus]KQT37387.1 orotidine 5'-phosphate decarboxylase [Methylophilus sp. Leaf416]KQT55444.1 orotidine 5'-phosphate decarboxylase [Methylophilus sp. Leaf459]
MTDSKIIVALDYADAESAKALVNRLDPALCKLKVGKELFTAAGPSFVESLVKQGYGVFLDLKFHDIPNTVAKACQAAANLGVWMLNVHASGGLPMMQAAQEGLDKAYGAKAPLLIAVTVLTSMDESTLHTLGIQRSLSDHVLALAKLTQQAGLYGVVCSAQESAMLKQALGSDFCLVTPGIRPADASRDDQTRIVTPKDALSLGSHYLVIGRPITQAADPVVALNTIIKNI